MHHMLDMLFQDIRYALRSLRRAPMFVLTVLVIVSLGTGVASAMFGITRHLLLRPFDMPGQERVVLFADRMIARGEVRGGISEARLLAYQRGATQIGHVEAYAYDAA